MPEIDDAYHTLSKHPLKSSLVGEGVWVSTTHFDVLKEVNDGEGKVENSHEFWGDCHIRNIAIQEAVYGKLKSSKEGDLTVNFSKVLFSMRVGLM